MVVPQASPKAGAEIWNEGTPFRCLGLHTHWKAPAEAQTGFSEDILQITILQDRDRSSTARHYRHAKYDSQNPFNITSRELSVNQAGQNFAPLAALARRVPNRNSIRLAGFEKSSCTRSMPHAAKRRKLSQSLYT